MSNDITTPLDPCHVAFWLHFQYAGLSARQGHRLRPISSDLGCNRAGYCVNPECFGSYLLQVQEGKIIVSGRAAECACPTTYEENDTIQPESPWTLILAGPTSDLMGYANLRDVLTKPCVQQ